MDPKTPTITPTRIACELFACAAVSTNSEHKRAWMIELPRLILQQAQALAECRYTPLPLTVFAVTDPKLREIFAPAYVDRLVHHWLVSHIEAWFDIRFIDDSYANRKGRGTLSAIDRLQHFMRQPGHGWYCKLDIAAFFPSIDRRVLLEIWRKALPRLPHGVALRKLLDHVVTAVLSQDPTDPAPRKSGNRKLLSSIPEHKSLFHTAAGVGMPIGSLTSQFFANVYLNELDQFVKHTLRVRGYVRYVDDLILLAEDSQTLLRWQHAIDVFLGERLKLRLHPHKMVIQRTRQGADFLGYIVFPDHRLARARGVRALRRRLDWMRSLIFPGQAPMRSPPGGAWQRWLRNHSPLVAPGVPSAAMLNRMLATINSYYGVFRHADTFRLRKHIYHHELGTLKRFFLPNGPKYECLKIKPVWLKPGLK